jgi:hydrogenase nickel incorporation protein HypA/HybF
MMHEASLMKGLMRQVEALAAAEGSGRVRHVAIWLGALSHFSPEHFTAHFVAAAAGTRAQDARLEITLSDDPSHPAAQDVVLESIEIEA